MPSSLFLSLSVSLSLPHTATEARKNERRRDEWQDRKPPASPPPPPLILSLLSLSFSLSFLRYTGPTWNRRSGITVRRRHCAIKDRERERCKEELYSLVDLKNPEVTPEASKQVREKKREKQELINGGGEKVGGLRGWGAIKGRISRTSRFSSGGSGGKEEEEGGEGS